MKYLLTAFMIAGLLTLGSIARPLPLPQAHNFSSSPASGIESGAILYAELSKTLDAKKAKPGDSVVALLLADVLSHGKIVAHRDSKLIGHITEAKPFAKKEDSESRLGIVFEKIRSKGGEEVPFNCVLMALHPAPHPVLDPPPKGPGPSLAGLRNGNTLDHGSTLDNDRYYEPAGVPKNPNLSSNVSQEKDANSRAMAEFGLKDMEGLSLTGSGGTQAIVSRKHTVKLESGVVVELRVTGSAGQ